MDLLTLLTGKPRGFKMTELVPAMGLPRSSVIRMLGTLEAYGLVEKDGRTVRLTEQFYLWSNRDRHALLKTKYRPVLRDILNEVKEVVLLGLQEGNSVVHIDYLEWDHQIRVAPLRETRHELERTAMGKLVLADRPELLPKKHRAGLERELAEVRQTGIGWNREEENEGVIVVATYGFTRAHTDAMIAVAWPKFRFTEEKAARAVGVIRDALRRHTR